jgi:hypothetical protein
MALGLNLASFKNGCFYPQVRQWEVESKNPAIPRNTFVLLEICARGM